MAGALGLPNSEVWIVPYDGDWPSLFNDEAERIRTSCSRELTEIVHVGSTAVPGLAAKPIIDIMLGIERFADAVDLEAPLTSLGYVCMGNYGVEGRVFYRRDGHSTHHLQVTERDSKFWTDEILFRDILRADVALARRYQTLKEKLAKEHRHNRSAYTEAKSEFIESALEKARGSNGKSS